MTPEQQVAFLFAKRVNRAIDYHRELLLAIHGKKRQAALESMLVEQLVLYTAVLWELFINDLILTYLVMSPDTYIGNLSTRVSQSIRERFGPSAAKLTAFDHPKKMSRARIEALVDPKGFNVGAQSAGQLAKRANEVLSAQYAKKFAMSQEDADFTDFLIALRNYLGHRSKASRVHLRSATKGLSGVNAQMNAPFKDVAGYLKTRVGADQRAIVIAQRLVAIASTLG